MKHIFAIATAGIVLGCAPAEPVALSGPEQARLAEALEGRAAGEPVACVSQIGLRDSRVLGDGVILFEGPGGVRYVNRPSGGCPGTQFGRALRTQTPVSRLCRGDIVTVFDPVSGVEYGGCGLGEFVPYRRVG